MKIQIEGTLRYGKETFQHGSVVDLPDKDALAVIAAGTAKPAKKDAAVARSSTPTKPGVVKKK